MDSEHPDHIDTEQLANWFTYHATQTRPSATPEFADLATTLPMNLRLCARRARS